MAAMKTPPGLGKRGAAYWRAVTEQFDFSTSESALLMEVCRTLDNLDALAAAVTRDGATVSGSTGQTVVHPALTEARGQRLTLHRLIAALALPDEEGQTIPTTATTRAKRAASVRWAGHTKETA